MNDTQQEAVLELARHLEKAVDQRDDLLEALQKIAAMNISDGMSRYEMKEIARKAIARATQ